MELLFWIGLILVIGLGESIKDSIDAHNYKKSGGIEAKYPEVFKNNNYDKK